MCPLPFHFLVAMLCGWLQHEQQGVIAFLREENRVLKARLLGERHLRHLVREFVAHYREERNHQGIGNELIEPPPVQRTSGPVYRRQRVGVLNYYFRSAA